MSHDVDMTSVGERAGEPGSSATGSGLALEPAQETAETWHESYPYDQKMTRHEYEDIKRSLQIELLKLQSWIKETGQKVVLLFEGRDAAGKGGTIKRFTEHLNPRGARVVAWRSRRSASTPSGISSATSSTSRPPARSCCWTGPGTTGRAWSA